MHKFQPESSSASASNVRPARRRRRLQQRYGAWAVVTGASSGIGRWLARGLAEEGLHVVLAARSSAALLELADELRADFGVDARAVACDLARIEGVDRLCEAARDLEVGVLVHAAGFGSGGPLIAGDENVEAEMLAVNCGAALRLALRFGRRFAERRRGAIVLLSSLVAFQGVPNSANYAATKAYVQSLAEALRVELRGVGVDVLSSAPGPVHSGFAARAGMTLGFAENAEDVARGTLDALGRTGTVRPGWISKGLEASLRLLPRVLRVRVMGLVMGGMVRESATSGPRS